MPEQSSLSAAAQRIQWRATMRWNIRLHLAFAQCNLYHWEDAERTLQDLERGLKYMVDANVEDLSRWTAYLSALIAQGTGDLDTALRVYQSPMFSLPDQPPSMRLSSAADELSLLAGLNTVLIMRNPSHAQHRNASSLVQTLEVQTLPHRNKALGAITFLLKAHDPAQSGTETIIHRKQNLQHGLTAARAMSNSQVLAIAINFMNTMFFRGIAGPQSNKSLQTGYVLSKRSGSPLWTLVASNMWTETMEQECVRGQQYSQLKQDAETAEEKLPDIIRQAFGVQGDD